MLKQIAIVELRLGMHLHALCGRWVDHPFWKTKFLLTDPADLAALAGSGLKECWIDVAKGLDVAPAAAAPATSAPEMAGSAPAMATSASALATSPAPAISAPAAPTPDAPPLSASAPVRSAAARPAASIADELPRAAAILRQSRQVVLAVFQEARLGQAIDASRCQPLVADIAESVGSNRDALISLARLKTQDAYTYLHSVAVCALMVVLAQGLGLSEEQVREAGLAGLLHDVGKALIPIEILAKPGKLTDAEFATIQTHPQQGHDLLVRGSPLSAVVLDVCLHHHERPDGKGYPDALAGDGIALITKMASVCDVYDAITSDRPYKKRWDPAEAIARMADWTRTGQFDPAVFAAFLKSLGVYPTGSLVRLRSGRLAVVVEQNPEQPKKPKLRCFYSTRAMMPIPLTLLDTADSRCDDAIVARESNEKWQFAQIDEIWAGREVLNRLEQAA